MSPPLSVSTDFDPRHIRGFFLGSGAESRLPPFPCQPCSDVPAESQRVLIVDDHADAAESLAIVLSTEGYEVRTCADGADAYRTIASWRPRVALIDLDLPTLGGLEIARRTRALAFGNELLLAAVTGYGRDSDLESSRQAGFDAHLVKPVDPEDVLRWLAQTKVNRAR